MELDSSYETDYVWQMTIHQDGSGREVHFKTERLPRPMEVHYPAAERRLRLALPREQCFLVAVGKEEPTTLGYLTMRHDPAHDIAIIGDLVVTRALRRRRIGSRLLRAARMWAQEHNLARIMIETQTKNYPAIAFCQKAGLVFCGFNDQYFQNQDIAVFFGQSLR